MRLRRRTGAVALALAVVVAEVAGTALPAGLARAATGCANGLGDRTILDGATVLDVRTLANDTALAVGMGGADAGGFLLAARAISGWTSGIEPVAGASQAFLAAIDQGPDGTVWGAGMATSDDTDVPGGFDAASAYQRVLLVRRTDGAWIDESPARSGVASVASAIDVAPDGRVVAAGALSPGHAAQHAVVWARVRGRWRTERIPSFAGSSRLGGVLALGGGTAWAVGSAVTRRGIDPIVIVRRGGRWQRETVDPKVGDTALVAIDGTGDDDLRAVGWRYATTRIEPVILQRHADAWHEVAGPATSGTLSILTSIGGTAEGRTWIGGATWLGDALDYSPLVTASSGGGWTPWGFPGTAGWYVSGIGGDPAGSGWAALVATRRGTGTGSLLARICPGVVPASRRTVGRGRQAHRLTNRRLLAIERRWDAPLAGSTTVARRPRIPMLPEPIVSDRVVLRDIAGDVGLAQDSWSYRAPMTGDVDGDGKTDVVFSRHRDPLAVYLRRGDGYEAVTDPGFGLADRHGCAVGRIDAGSRADIACVTGGQRGVGLTSNELFLQPASGAVSDGATAAGITDPTARGRVVVLFDADGDGDQDLFIGNMDVRGDGAPSMSRLLRNNGTGRFAWDFGSGLTMQVGIGCAHARDVDADGDLDLVLCVSLASPAAPGLKVFLNDGGLFTEAARRLGVTTIAEIDADTPDLDGDGHADLVQLAADRIRVALWRRGAWRPVYERRLTLGRSIAFGDVDGDGALDIYLGRGSSASPTGDTILLNAGTGRRWTPIVVPGASDGPGSAVALDHDGNGLADFVVLHGAAGPGPVRLIAAYPPDEGP